MKVYVTNVAGHDTALLRTYGELVPITIGRVNLSSPDRVMYDVVNVLKDCEEGDWLALVGHSFIVAIAATLWITKNQKVCMLVWDNRLKKYREVVLTSYHLNEMLQLCRDASPTQG